MAEGKKTSPWLYVGLGCLGVIVIIFIAVGGLVTYTYKKANQVKAELKDPALRMSKVQEMLGCEELPEGYYPMLTFSLPFVVKTAILTDREGEMDGTVEGFDERGFIYVDFAGWGMDKEELRDYLTGKTDDPEALRRSNIQLDMEEIIRRGELDVGGIRCLYLAQRGGVHTEHGRADGITSLILVDCQGSDTTKLGIWFGPDPDPDSPVDSLDLSNTPADESAMRDFMSYFQLCGQT